MLLDSNYTIVPQIRFTLTYDNDIRKVITVKTRDTIDCSYKKDGERFSIKGVVAKIGCNFNSSLGRVGTTAYLQIDGSSEYSGQVEMIQPSQILDINIISTSGSIDNVVCSIDNEDQKITLIRENEIGVFQYSLDGVTWRSPATGAQGMSAYECAVKLGFEGSEEEWLESLKGKPGCPGEPGALEIYKIFNSFDEAERNRDLIPKGKLVAVVTRPNTVLLVRNGHHKPCPCPCHDHDDKPYHIKGYDFVGYLTVGPKGDKGDPGKDGVDGKSAYQYAVEGGFPGTEGEFMQILSRCSVAVTNYFMGPSPDLMNTVIGPMDLRVFGYTNRSTFKSKEISRIDVSSPNEPEDQTLIFPSKVILRAVPTDNIAAKPNVIIKGQKYVADCIMNKDGKVGVMRRVTYIDSYSGETIVGDWISSTGELDMGAQVQYVSYGKFEPFSEEIQNQYRKLHTYDQETVIQTTESTYVSVVYPIDIKKFVEQYVDTHVKEYLEEKAPEIIVPVVEEIVEEKMATKQDKLVAGAHINISSSNEISVKDLGDIPAGKTLVQYVDEEDELLSQALNVAVQELGNEISTLETATNNKFANVNTELTKKQAKLTAGKNINISSDNVISCDADSTLGEDIVTTKAVGGIEAGVAFTADTTIAEILKQMLAPSVPPVPPEEGCVYFGVTTGPAVSLDGLTKELVDEEAMVADGISHRYTANEQYLAFAVKARLGEVISIKDPSGFEQMDGWDKVTYNDGERDWYIYRNKESLTISNFKLTFIFTD